MLTTWQKQNLRFWSHLTDSENKNPVYLRFPGFSTQRRGCSCASVSLIPQVSHFKFTGAPSTILAQSVPCLQVQATPSKEGLRQEVESNNINIIEKQLLGQWLTFVTFNKAWREVVWMRVLSAFCRWSQVASAPGTGAAQEAESPWSGWAGEHYDSDDSPTSLSLSPPKDKQCHWVTVNQSNFLGYSI